MAYDAHGTALTLGGSVVLQLTSAGRSRSRNEIRVTNHDSEGIEEYITSIRDEGTISCEAIFTEQGYGAVEDAFESSEPVTFLLSYPNTFSVTGECFVTALDEDAPFEGAQTFSFTLRITGETTRETSSAT